MRSQITAEQAKALVAQAESKYTENAAFTNRSKLFHKIAVFILADIVVFYQGRC